MNNRHDCDKIILKIIVVGAKQSGKSCLVEKYVNNHFPPEYNITTGIDFFVKQYKGLKMFIWDAAGEKVFESIIKSYSHKLWELLLF